MSKIRKIPCSRVLPHPLTTQEVYEAVKSLSKVMREEQLLEEQLRNVAAHHREKIRQKKAELEVLMSRVRDETDYRKVDCEERRDYARGKVKIVRLDTNETIDETEMTPEERQVEMELMGAGPSA